MSATIETPQTLDEQIAALEAERDGQTTEVVPTGAARSALTRKINQLRKQRDEAAAETSAAMPPEQDADDADRDRRLEEATDRADEIPAVSAEALEAAGEKFDELNAEQLQRAMDAPRVKGGLRGKALAAWILGGKAGVDAQQAEGRARATAERKTSSKPRTRKGAVGAKDEDIAAAMIASEVAGEKGKGLSQRITPREANVARAAMAALIAERVSAGHFPNAPADAETTPSLFPAALGFTSERAMRAYVNGSEKALKDDARAGVKDLTRRINSHQVWARKAAAAAFGVMRQMQG